MSDYIPYTEKKKKFDSLVMHYIAKKIFEDIEDTDAYELDILDSVGNELGGLTKGNEWAFTHLDRFILALKQMAGQDRLRSLLNSYKWVSEVDPLFIMNMDEKTDFEKINSCLHKIVTKIDDSTYLPSELEHDDGYIEDDSLDFCKQVSKTLTIITFLLYTLRNNSIPTSIDFDTNIKSSVECTFHIRPTGTFAECLDFCKEYNMVDSSKITNEGIRKLVSIAKDLNEGGMLISKDERIENQVRNWKKISEVRND